MVELVDTIDSKSIAVMACGFDSLCRYQQQSFELRKGEVQDEKDV